MFCATKKISCHVLSAADSLTKGHMLLVPQTTYWNWIFWLWKMAWILAQAATGKKGNCWSDSRWKCYIIKLDLPFVIRLSLSLPEAESALIDWCLGIVLFIERSDGAAGWSKVSLLHNCVHMWCMHSVLAWRNLVLGVQKLQGKYRIDMCNCNLGQNTCFYSSKK